MKRQSRAVLEHADHGGSSSVVLLRADIVGRLRGEDLLAGVAAQPLDPPDGGRDGSVPAQAYDSLGPEGIDLAALAAWAVIPGLQRLMRDRNAAGTHVCSRRVAPMCFCD